MVVETVSALSTQVSVQMVVSTPPPILKTVVNAVMFVLKAALVVREHA